MIKKYIYIISICFCIFWFSESYIFAYSDSFTLMLETMQIPENNKIGAKINEEIYNEYKLLVYGSPTDNYSGQRWKDVENGKWTKNGGSWKGNGVRGEYWILGTNYNGKEVHNHLFPVDKEPPTTPTSWRYAVITDALDSWQETDKYMDDMQREYMITQKLMRNNVVYDITVKDIGFNKVRIENYATWRTKGTVYTERYDINNKRWAANFMVEPMAGDAVLEGYADFPLGKEYSINKEQEKIEIPIIYGSHVLNLTEYAKKEHVKEIRSQLYINGEYIEDIIDTKSLEVKKESILNISRNEYDLDSTLTIDIQIKSTLFTTFITDGALVDIKNYEIIISSENTEAKKEESKYNNVFNEEYIEYPDFEPPKITSIEINRITNGKQEPLYISEKTGKKFICAGQTISITAKAINIPEKISIEFEGDSSITTFDNLTMLFEWTEPRKRNEKTLFKSLKDFEKMYKGKVKMENLYTGKDEEEFYYTYVIPYGTKQTLHSWNTLRDISKNAFNINEGRLFERINDPYEIVFKVSGPTGTTTKRVELDVFERWDTLYNRSLSKYIKK